MSRLIAEALAAALTTRPVVAITGPRTVGKSTLAIEVTGRTGGTFVGLDDPAVQLATADPTAFVGIWPSRRRRQVSRALPTRRPARVNPRREETGDHHLATVLQTKSMCTPSVLHLKFVTK